MKREKTNQDLYFIIKLYNLNVYKLIYASIISHQEADSGQNPFFGFRFLWLHLQIGGSYISWSSHACCVDRTRVLGRGYQIGGLDRDDIDDRDFGV